MIKLKRIIENIQYKKIDNETISINNIIYKIEVGDMDDTFGFYIQDEKYDESICSLHAIPAYSHSKKIKNVYIIDDIKTEPKFQRKGLATLLFNYAKDFFKKQNIKLVHSPTRTDSGWSWGDTID